MKVAEAGRALKIYFNNKVRYLKVEYPAAPLAPKREKSNMYRVKA